MDIEKTGSNLSGNSIEKELIRRYYGGCEFVGKTEELIRRYYGSCEFVDRAEELSVEGIRNHLDITHANVHVHLG